MLGPEQDLKAFEFALEAREALGCHALEGDDREEIRRYVIALLDALPFESLSRSLVTSSQAIGCIIKVEVLPQNV